MLILNLSYKYFSALLLSVLFFNACASKTPKNSYDLTTCKEELLSSEDYRENEAIDRIVVVKKERRMYLYKEGKVQRSIPISLGKNPIGHKVKRGDYRTPEGTFFIHRKLCSPKYYRSLCISYPRPIDIRNAEEKGFDPGGDITIHAQPKWNAKGKGNAYTLSKNWTQGCVAVTNNVMETLWYEVREGVPIVIR
jgi:murein L,D-transpeptidase YafK